MSELTPLTRAQAAEFGMATADLVAPAITWDPKVGAVDVTQVRRTVGAAAGAAQAMGQIMTLAGRSNEQAVKAAAALQLTAGGLEVLSALRGLTSTLAAVKYAEGSAALAKWGPAGLVVAGIAAGGAAAYAFTMDSREYNFTADYSTEAGQRHMMTQLEVAL